MPGPRPKPTALKIREGNPGKRALNGAEPQPRRRSPKPPPHLTPGARAEWRRLSRILGPMGILTEAEADVLAVYAQTYDRWVQASAELQIRGLVVLTERGAWVRNPLLRVIDDCLRVMLRCMNELGLTPAARVRLTSPASDEDPLDAFLAGL